MRYLDPKNDLTFKKVFGQHPHLLISFLNSMLPFEDGRYIKSLEYLPAEMVPVIPLMKNSIVDVRCQDNYGRQFVVEMQMLWTDSFMQRVLFNASKAYIRQLDKSFKYSDLQPVYALSMVNSIFQPKKDGYYHHYHLVHAEDKDLRMDGLEFVFIELPKFKAKNIRDKRLEILWLRYLTEIEHNTEHVDLDLLNDPNIKEALDCIMESAYTLGELDYYDRYWDEVRREVTLRHDTEQKALEKGIKKGIEKGRKEGIEEGIEKGIKKGRKDGIKEGMEKGMELQAKKIALALIDKMSLDAIVESTGLSVVVVKELKRLFDKYGDKAVEHLDN